MNWKDLGNYSLYIIPGYGVYDQFFKKHRGERSALGIIGASAWTVGFVVKMALLPAYIGKGVGTGNWHPFKFDSMEKTEQIQKNKLEKKDSLEKTINYEELLRKSLKE